jgi:hypothetical protein
VLSNLFSPWSKVTHGVGKVLSQKSENKGEAKKKKKKKIIAYTRFTTVKKRVKSFPKE